MLAKYSWLNISAIRSWTADGNLDNGASLGSSVFISGLTSFSVSESGA